MSLLENFMENTNIFRGDESRIDEAAFDALVQAHGIEVAKGYLKAMHEMTGILNHILFVEKYGWENFKETPSNTYGKVFNLHKALLKFVESNELDTENLKKPFPYYRTIAQGF